MLKLDYNTIKNRIYQDEHPYFAFNDKSWTRPQNCFNIDIDSTTNDSNCLDTILCSFCCQVDKINYEYPKIIGEFSIATCSQIKSNAQLPNPTTDVGKKIVNQLYWSQISNFKRKGISGAYFWTLKISSGLYDPIVYPNNLMDKSFSRNKILLRNTSPNYAWSFIDLSPFLISPSDNDNVCSLFSKNCEDKCKKLGNGAVDDNYKKYCDPNNKNLYY
jgi:hypothetical protein